ncbi:hypothetical protein [Antarctobacter jejuensis]|uniref:hypothetical protein n=1 Tax=Antarctobacter jejuensis TaxID=1439938 RepID=UPI003FD66DB3
MNAPFHNKKHLGSRLSDDQIDQIVDRFLSDEARREATFDAYRKSDLERFLCRLNRKRRRAFLRRLVPSVQIHNLLRRRSPWGRKSEPVDVSQGRGTYPSIPVRQATGWRPRWQSSLRFLIFLALLKVAGYYAAEPVLGPVVSTLPSGLAARAEIALRCGDAVMLRDDTGSFVGTIPVDPSGACTSGHLTAPFNDATALRVAEAIAVLEGRWARSPLTLFGQDLVGLVRGAAFEIERSIRGLDREEVLNRWLAGERPTFLQPRGSGPVLSAFEALVGQPGRVDEPLDKVRNVGAAMVFVARTMGMDENARAHFLAERMTVIHGEGRPLAGALAAELLFGGPPGNLGEVCLFAAASTFNLYQDLPVFGAHVDRRYERARARARVCATRLARNDEERLLAYEVIEAFRNPSSMLSALPGGSAINVRDALGAAGIAEPLSDAQLTLDVEAQTVAQETVRDVLDQLSYRLAPGVCFAGNCDVRADYLVAVAEIDDEALPLRVAFTNRHRSLLGPFSEEDASHAVALAPAFGLGSQHKALLALIAARHGESRLCNRIYGSITNTSGPAPVDDCTTRSPSGWVDVREALGRSMNLPWVDVARRHALEMSVLETNLGFLGEPAGPGGAALGFGRRAPPERFMALFAAVARAADGSRPATEGLMVLDGYPARSVDLEAVGYEADVVRETAALFSAPFEENGTLRRLHDQLRPLGCTPTLGKTGTTEIAGGGPARSRTATVVVSCGDRQFVVFASIESSIAQQPVGAITARELGEMIAAALSGLGDQRPER